MKKILITGGTGMLGSAFKNTEKYEFIKASKKHNLTNSASALSLIGSIRPSGVIHLAAKVGGVKGNTEYVADFFRENILINTNLLEACKQYNTPKVVSLLSTCVYPDTAKYPLTEDQIHLGHPHESNFGYAYAKRMLHIQSKAYRQQLGSNFICAVPNNLFGKNDNFDLDNGHVIPSVIRKIYEAKKNNFDSVSFWGDGTALREFTYSEDIAYILVFLLENYNGEAPVNIGNTEEISIKRLVEEVAKVFDYSGKIVWDTSKPTGQKRKPSSNLMLRKMGYKRKYSDFKESIKETCEWFAENYPNVRGID